jgi:hypothetical protein
MMNGPTDMKRIGPLFNAGLLDAGRNPSDCSSQPGQWHPMKLRQHGV